MKLGEPFNPYGCFVGIFVPVALVRSVDLSPGAKLLYGTLCRYAGKDGQCFPSVGRLAVDLGRQVRQVRFYLRELEDFKLVRRVGEPGKSNRFEFLRHAVFESEAQPLQENAPLQYLAPLQENAGGGCNILPGGAAISCTHKRISKRVSEENHSFDHWFADFWEAYPRKVGKAAALKAAKGKAKTEAERATILAGLQRQLPELRSREVRYIPHPSSWLNGQRWLDEPEPVEQERESLAQQILREATS